MKNNSGSQGADNSIAHEDIEDMLPEYDFDYRKARPNRFAESFGASRISVMLDPDVAEVFTTSEAVNRALRTLLEAIPKDFELIRNTQSQTSLQHNDLKSPA